MSESSIEVWKRKIRNGRRKQRDRVLRAQAATWDILKFGPPRKLRTLSASWTVDAITDMQSFHDSGVEDELAKILQAEIDKEIIQNIRKVAYDTKKESK
jgi:hypothetical protein